MSTLSAPKLTPQQREYVKYRAMGLGQEAAARQAGYGAPKKTGYLLDKREKIRAAIDAERRAVAEAAKMTRQKVVDGLLEAIQLARTQADAQAMIAGWREIAKVCGLNAPEVRKVEVEARVRKLRGQFETMSDEELLEIATGQVIEGEFRQLSDAGNA